MKKIVLVNMLMLCVFYGNAQNASSNIEQCKNIENDLSRLMCYDQLFKMKDNAEDEADIQAKMQLDEDQNLETQTLGPQLESSPVIAPKPRLQAEQVASAMPETIAPSPVQLAQPAQRQESLIDRFGAEDLEQAVPSDELSRIDTVIDSVTENSRDIRTFILANGQVWRETETSRLRLKAGMSIFIEKGAFSAHYLGKEESNRRVRVKRVK